MKSTISQDGTIGNFGGIQPDGLSFADLTVFSPIIVPAALPMTSVGINAPVPDAGPIAAPSAPSPFTLTSGAGVASGSTVNSGLVSIPATTSIVAYAPLLIVPDFAPSITNQISSVSDPTTALQIETAIETAINYYDTNWTSSVPIGHSVGGTIVNVVTVAIEFGYGTVGIGATVAADNASQSTYGASVIGNYAALQSAVSGVLPNLPASDPTTNGTFVDTDAQADILGLGDSGTAVAGSVGLASIAQGVTFDYSFTPGSTAAAAGEIGAVGALEHEISEIFGRVSLLDGSVNGGGGPPVYSIFDLFRFSGTATPALTPGPSDYFSLNNGITALGFFNDNAGNGGDAGDWDSSGPNKVDADSFDAFLKTSTSGTISNLDTMVLSNIGFQPVCYLEGTRILTTQGEKRIEALAVGDQLPTLLGGPGRVIWLGRRTMDLRKHPKPWLAWPVRIRAGAFAPGLPARDLYLSPDHAVYTGEVLIPVKLLINGSTIQQVKLDHVVYHHVELRQHDIIQAEGLPCESYLDAGDRDTFSGGPVTALYPEFSARRWEMAGCAPLVLTGAVLHATRLRLAKRAEQNDDRDRLVVAAVS